MSGLSESEWLLQRLCESLVRLAKKPYVPRGEHELKRDGTREDEGLGEDDWVDGWVGGAERVRDERIPGSSKDGGEGSAGGVT